MKTGYLTASTVKKCLCALLPGAVAAGCTVGIDYMKPEIVVPASFRAEEPTFDAASFADLPWWYVFSDPALQKLVYQALSGNYDVQVAVARIEQARATLDVARAEGKPQVGYDVSAEGAKEVIPQRRSAGSVTYGAFAGLISAAWELDIWGRIRQATNAARANLFAQEDVRHGVILTLVSDLAAGYFRLIELDQELAIAQESARVY
jgi:multidrug efflux system outer membrane protein